jgi:small subunit ribosomal protein S1
MTEEKIDAIDIDYNKTFDDIREGQVVKGCIIDITAKDAMVDIHYKSEGNVSLQEFASPKELKVGDEVEVYIEKLEDDEGRCILSRRKAEKSQSWDRVVAGLNENDNVRAQAVRKVKGGIMMDIGVEAFLPASLAFLKGYGSLNSLMGQTLDVKIVTINPKRRNVIVSRKDVLEKEKKQSREKVISELEVGQVRKGIVKNITDFGAFISLGDIDGLLHITDLAWGRVNHPSEVLKVGDRIDVKILSFDKESMKVSLGLKQIKQNPWSDADVRYPVGSKVRGKVVNIMPYGIFVELEKGIEGLVHVSEMSWSKRVANPNEMFKVSDEVEVMVLSIDKANQKISLGIRQTEQNPWVGVEDRYPVGKKIKGTVWNLTDFGGFVQMEEGIDGLIHISDMSWTKKVNHPKEILKKGETVEAVVLNVDQINRKLALGLKQLQEDPWLKIVEKYPPNSVVEGTITKAATFGVFVEIEKDIEGLLHISEMSPEAAVDIPGHYPVGNKIQTRILKVDASAHKIALSAKGL